MTLLSVVKEVCARVGVVVPSAVVPAINANRTMQEMLACANEMARRIATDTREWTALHIAAVLDGATAIPGDYNSSYFNVPANYQRMLLNSSVRLSSTPAQPLRFIPSFDEWIERRLMGTASSHGEWIINAGRLWVHPTVPAGTVVTFPYLDKNCVALNGGGFGTEFVNDADSFRLNERLLKLGMIFDWKQSKGSPYAEDMGTWSDAMAIAMGSDKPAPIMIDRHPISANARVAYPWPLPT